MRLIGLEYESFQSANWFPQVVDIGRVESALHIFELLNLQKYYSTKVTTILDSSLDRVTLTCSIVFCEYGCRIHKNKVTFYSKVHPADQHPTWSCFKLREFYRASLELYLRGESLLCD